jgi:hypothetical protein
MRSDRGPQVTPTDHAVLGPLAEHRILITPQVAVLLGVAEQTAEKRLRRLREAGLLHYGRTLTGGPGIASISRRGLELLEDPAPEPSENLRAYRHDVGVGWLWLGARDGAFGALSSVVTEQTMRAADSAGRPTAQGAAHGLGLGLLGPHGRPQRHYPDLVLHTESGHRIAVELELTAKSRPRMARIMTAYATDPRIDAVVYLVPTPQLATLVSDAARRAGIADLVDVRAVAKDRIHGVGDDRTSSRASSRGASAPRTRPFGRSGAELGAGR